MKKIIKISLYTLLGVVFSISIATLLFLNLNPQFGQNPTRQQKKEYSKFNNYQNGQFINIHPSPMNINFRKLIKEFTKDAPFRNPSKNIEVMSLDPNVIESRKRDTTYLTWFGHSTFLLEMDGYKILLDPMLGEVAAPHRLLGPKRYSESLPIEIEDLPFIDAVVFSHDHYDHLDYTSIQRLKDKVGEFYVPLGVGNHLIKWGVDKEKIHEFNWWESTNFNEIQLVCTPSRHFSGRGLLDRASTLWASWVIKGTKDNIYFSGDSGYDTHFKEIGDKYGPFDIALLECGQYNTDWKYIHMMPEETVLAGIDLNSKLIMPIHWGAFTLAFHDWTDPVERATKKARELNVAITTPIIGETIKLGAEDFPIEEWWKQYN